MLDRNRLAAVVAAHPQQQLLGWAAVRRNAPARPSLRDRAMLDGLAGWLGGGGGGGGGGMRDGLLLGMFVSSVDKSHTPYGAVHSFDSRFFGGQSGSGLRPVSVGVRNRQATHTGEYEALGLDGLSDGLGMLAGSGGGGLDAAVAQQAQESRRLAEQTEGVVVAAFGQLERLAAEVERGEDRFLALTAAVATARATAAPPPVAAAFGIPGVLLPELVGPPPAAPSAVPMMMAAAPPKPLSPKPAPTWQQQQQQVRHDAIYWHRAIRRIT